MHLQSPKWIIKNFTGTGWVALGPQFKPSWPKSHQISFAQIERTKPDICLLNSFAFIWQTTDFNSKQLKREFHQFCQGEIKAT